MSVNRTHEPAVQELDNINIPLPVRTCMPNGIPLNIIHAGEQDVVRLDLLFKGGSWQQPQKLQALFTNRMLREGSRLYTSADIAEKLDYYGAWLELASSTDHAYITLYSLNKYFAETMEIIASIVKEPLFPERELNTVVETNIQQYLVNSTKVDFIGHRSLLKSLYGESHPCGRFAVENDYRKITPKMLIDFYEKVYHKDNCSVYLSGKVTDDIVHVVEMSLGIDGFGGEENSATSHACPILASADKRIFTEYPDAIQSSVKMGNVTITRSHPDYLKLRVLLTLFGGYFGSRLVSNIREEKGYTYGIAAGLLFYPDSGLLVISSETANEFVEPLIHEVYCEIDKLHHELVGKDELSVVKNYMLGEMCRSYESPFSLSDAWMFIQTSGLDDDFFNRSVEAIKSVTPAELKDLACRYLCKEKLKEIIVGKKLS